MNSLLKEIEEYLNKNNIIFSKPLSGSIQIEELDIEIFIMGMQHNKIMYIIFENIDDYTRIINIKRFLELDGHFKLKKFMLFYGFLKE